MSACLRPCWAARLFPLLLVWATLSGIGVSPLLAGMDADAPPPQPPMARRTAAQDAAWAAWESLSPDLRAKVDGRILAELRGDALPAHLGASPLPALPAGALPSIPRQHTRFLVYLNTAADLSALDEQIYASQADRRSALVETLRSTAQSSQSDLLRLLAQRSGKRADGSTPVVSYQPFFIVNAIGIEADLATITELARRTDVGRIVANYPLIPVAQQPAQSGEASQIETAAGDSYEWNLRKVQADRVHSELGIRGAGAVVGGFDTGVSYRHPALIRQYRGNENGVFNHNYNWFVADGELYPNGNLGPSLTDQPLACDEHGTHTMGTMVGDAGRNAPIIGMAPDARWIAAPGICGETMPGGIRDDIGGIKTFQWFLCPTDLTGDLSTADCAKAPDVVNSSWGSANPVDDTFRPILQVLRAAGIAPVFASGNPSAGAGSIAAPANAPEAITVGATDDYDILAWFSGQGPSSYPGEQKPELSAPGVFVRSSVGTTGYETLSGTSMAAPHVSGLIALLVSADLQDGERDFDVDDLERLMALSSVDLGDPGADTLYGFGRIDAFAAVQLGLTAGDLRGQILDEQYGTPVPHIWLDAYHAGLDRHFATQTDASGAYSLTLPAGNYAITLSGWGYHPKAVGSHKVVAGALALHNFSLLSTAKATISGVVRDENGPVADALIYPAGNPAVQSRSGGDGRYQILLPLGQEELVVQAARHRILRQPVNTPGVGAQVNLTLKRAPSILLVDTSSLGGWFLGWPVYRTFTRALEDQRYQFDLWRIQSSDFFDTQPGIDGSTRYGLPSAATLKGYDLVIWVQSLCNDAYCEANSTADLGADPALTEYLDSGGRLFLSGQDVGSADGTSVLFDDYLQADLLSEYGGYPGEPVTGVDFLSSFQMTLTNSSLYGYANGFFMHSPDAVTPQPGGLAFPVLNYGSGVGAAALAVAPCNADYRAFYLAVGYENLAPRAGESQPDWTRLLDASITWLASDAREDRYTFSTDEQFGSDNAGGRINYTFSVANLSPQPMNIAMTLAGNRWPTTLLHRDAPLVSPVQLPACTRQNFAVAVDLPYSSSLGERDVVTLTVASVSHPGLPGYAQQFETVQMAQWRAAPPLPGNRRGMSTIAQENGYHVVGGWVYPTYDDSGNSIDGGPVADHRRFDPCKAEWESRAPLPEARYGAASAAIGDRFFVAGGVPSDSNYEYIVTDTLFIYDSKTDAWSQGAPMPRSLYSASGAAVDGKFYVFGGFDNNYYPSRSFLVYDPATDQWQDRGEMGGIGARAGGAVTTMNGIVYLFSDAFDDSPFVSYEPATNQWQRLPFPLYWRYGSALVAAPDGTIYLLGGESPVVERFDPATATWSPVNLSLNTGRSFVGGAYVEGTIYLVGGSHAGPTHESLRLTGSFCESGLVEQQSTVSADGEIVYTLDIRSSDRTYPHAHLAAPLLAEQRFVGFGENSMGAVYNPATRAVEWSGALPANSPPRRLVYTVGLDAGAWQPGERITHTVHLDNGASLSMTRSAATLLFAPDFSASAVEVSQPAVLPDAPFTYTVNLRSSAPVSGRVILTDALPAGLEYVAGSLAVGSGTGGYNPATHTVQWQGTVGAARPGFVNLGNGYTWADTLGEEKSPAPEFVWQDIRSAGTPVVSGINQIVCDLPMGFAFPFYGDEYTQVCVDTSGYISFADTDYPDPIAFCPSPYSTAPTPRIAGLWALLTVDDGVYMQTFGDAPRRYTIFQWSGTRLVDYGEENGTSRPPDTDFQIVIHEDGRVQIHMLHLGQAARYASVTGLFGPTLGQDMAYQCSGNNRKLSDRTTVEFLPPGGFLTPSGEKISFQATARQGTPINTLITNTVSIRSGGQSHTRTAAILVRSVDLTASTKTASHTELLPGESAAYTVTLTNRGLATSAAITLTDLLPAPLTYVPASLVCSSGLCSESGGRITWLGELAPGASVSIFYSATLGSVLPDRTPITNTAQIRSGGVADLGRSAVVYARSTNLSASFFDFGDRPHEPGDRFTLRALLRNTGIRSTDADFSLLLPPELRYLPGTLGCGIGHCRLEGDRILWSGSLPPRGLVAVQMDVELSTAVVSGQKIRVHGEMVDRTWGLPHQVIGEMHVAIHTFLPLIVDGRKPPIYLPLVEHRASPPPSPPPTSPLPTPTPD
jgi:uncharacterized repeat protein (TIGR01451 family)